MDIKVLCGLVCGAFSIFVLAVILLHAQPVKAGTDWACDNGGTNLNDYIERLSNLPTRSWHAIRGGRDYKMVFLLLENGYAEIRVIVGHCAFISSRISPESIIETFDLDLKQVFPVLKKGSY